MRYHLDHAVLDAHSLRLWRNGQPVALEPLVIDLLLYLVRHRDRVVSKSELLDAVWRQRIVTESTLFSHMHAARRALGDDARTHRWIRSVPRRGYQFVGPVREEPAPGADGSARHAGWPRPDTGAAPPQPMTTSAAAAGLAAAAQVEGDDALSAQLFERALRERPRAQWIHRNLAPALLGAGRAEDAQVSTVALRRAYPAFSIASFREALPYPPRAHDRVGAQLRTLGLPA